MNETQKYPSPIVSLIPIAFLIGILVAIINAFGTDALSGGSQVALLMGTAVCTLMGIALYGRKWKAFEEAITNNIKEIAIAIIILLIIGHFLMSTTSSVLNIKMLSRRNLIEYKFIKTISQMLIISLFSTILTSSIYHLFSSWPLLASSAPSYQL